MKDVKNFKLTQVQIQLLSICRVFTVGTLLQNLREGFQKRSRFNFGANVTKTKTLAFYINPTGHMKPRTHLVIMLQSELMIISGVLTDIKWPAYIH